MGSNADGADQVARTAESLSLEVIRTDMVPSEQGYAVSSTKIRERLEEGDVQAASDMLGYDYTMHGVVIAGNRLGRTIGFPTANMQVYEPLKLVPGNGVYFVKVETLGRNLYGMCNIGCRPTVGMGNSRTIETNIFGFDEDIYGLDMKLTFVRKIRDEVKFDSLEALRHQLEIDRDTCLSLL
jgi:riboflavin kinase/FMN adenylyltransferase